MITPRDGWFPVSPAPVPPAAVASHLPVRTESVYVLCQPAQPRSVWSTFFKGIGCLILALVPQQLYEVLIDGVVIEAFTTLVQFRKLASDGTDHIRGRHS